MSGPYYSDDHVTIWHGDCFDLLHDLDGIGAVITDPPYSSGGAFRGDRAQQTSTKYVRGDTAAYRPEFAGDNRDQRSYGPRVERDDYPAGIFAASPPSGDAKQHIAQKPESVMRWAVSLAQSGCTVLDPFMGSGTTLRASKDHGCKAIGIEVDERYCEIAAKRCAQEVLDFGAST